MKRYSSYLQLFCRHQIHLRPLFRSADNIKWILHFWYETNDSSLQANSNWVLKTPFFIFSRSTATKPLSCGNMHWCCCAEVTVMRIWLVPALWNWWLEWGGREVAAWTSTAWLWWTESAWIAWRYSRGWRRQHAQRPCYRWTRKSGEKQAGAWRGRCCREDPKGKDGAN